MERKLLIAAAFVPALALVAMPAADRTITATDPYAWSPATVTITPGETVTFEYPSGNSGHNVAWLDERPDSCDGNIPNGSVYGVKGWKGTCTFSRAGRYKFVCRIHEEFMQGAVVVEAPSPSPSPTPTPTPSASPPPGTSPTSPAATATPVATATPAPVAMRVAKLQRGTRVRGRVQAAPGARVDVRVRYKGRRIGRVVKTGPTSFSIPLKPRPKRLPAKLTVTVSVAPPTQARTFTVTLRK